MRTVPSRIVTGTSRSTRMLSVSRACTCTNSCSPVAMTVLPKHGACWISGLSSNLERLKVRVHVQPQSAVAWDDHLRWETAGRHRGRRATAVRMGGRDGGGDMGLGAAGGTGDDHRRTGLGWVRAVLHEHCERRDSPLRLFDRRYCHHLSG